jgi:S1-C subfamily serine protease
MIHCLSHVRLVLLLLACCLPVPWLQAVAQRSDAVYDADTVISALFRFSLPDDDIFWQGDFEEETPSEPEVIRQVQVLTFPGIITYRFYDSFETARESVHARIGTALPIDDAVEIFSTPDKSNEAIYDNLVSAHARDLIGRDVIVFESEGSYSACELELNVIVCGFSSLSWNDEPLSAAIMGVTVGLALFMDVAKPASEPKEIQVTPNLPPTQIPTREGPTSVPDSRTNSPPPSVKDRVIPAAVQIVVMANATGGGISDSRPFVTGSGTVISADGLILTNWHVVDMEEHRRDLQEIEEHLAEEGVPLNITLDEDIRIFVSDGMSPPEQRYFARVVDGDETLDLAVLQIVADGAGPLDSSLLGLPFVRLGNSDVVGLGDTIDIYGYPEIGGGSLTFTRGVVSGFLFEDGINERAWLTTDAVISAGSSGGTAVTQNGELVGVPTSGTPLECRPGDVNGDGELNADDVGCVPLGGSLGKLRPVKLALELLASAGWTPAPTEVLQTTMTAPTPTPIMTPTPTPTATATPTEIATLTPPMTPTSTPSPTPTQIPKTPTPTPPSESQVGAELLSRLPNAPAVDHAGCFGIVDDGTLAFEQLLGRFSGVQDAETRLQTWAWQASAFRQFGCDGPPDGEAGWIDISVHLFGNAVAAQDAVDYFAATRAEGGPLVPVEPPQIGDHAAALSGPAVNGKEFTIYASQGPLLVRVTGVSPSGIPFINVLTVTQSVLAAQQMQQQPIPTPPAQSPSLPASSYLPVVPAVRHRDCFAVLAEGRYIYSDVADALELTGLSASQFDELGWQDGAYRVFTCDEPPVGRAAQIDVGIHQFQDVGSAELALPYYSVMYEVGENETRSCDSAGTLVICVSGRSLTGSPLSDVKFVLNQVIDGTR